MLVKGFLEGVEIESFGLLFGAWINESISIAMVRCQYLYQRR